MHTEDPKFSPASSVGGAPAPAKAEKEYDEFDDAMFDMTAPHHQGGRHANPNKAKGGHP